MKKLVVFALSGVCCGLLFTSCRHNPDIPAFPVMLFQSDVLPVISGNCSMSGCHSSGGREEVFSLVSYDDVMQIVTPGDAHNSRLYTSISNHSLENRMPPSGPLADDDIKKIYLWIEQGAKNN